jgi:hypothetical protein
MEKKGNSLPLGQAAMDSLSDSKSELKNKKSFIIAGFQNQ